MPKLTNLDRGSPRRKREDPGNGVDRWKWVDGFVKSDVRGLHEETHVSRGSFTYERYIIVDI